MIKEALSNFFEFFYDNFCGSKYVARVISALLPLCKFHFDAQLAFNCLTWYLCRRNSV